MREARNDLALYSNAAVIAHATHQDAFSLSEAGYQFIVRQQKPPVCVRFTHLDWGYERFSLSEAGKRVTDPPYRVAKRSHP
jgi:hypothetical protein